MATPARDPDPENPGITGVYPVVTVDSPTGRGMLHTCLVCVNGDDLGRSIRIGLAPIVIGRGSVELALSATDISRNHAQISRDDDGFFIEDLGSANGTFLDGVPVVGPTRLRVGCRIQVGHTILVFSHYDELAGRIQQLQRLEAMGTMAGGIAHDFNNALAIILANLDFVGEALDPENQVARGAFEAISGAASSAIQLAKRMLRLGSRDPLTIGTVKLTPLVEQTRQLALRRSSATVNIVIDVEPGLAVLGSFDELQHALLNLYFNACDAMPTGGTWTVRCHAVRIDAAQAIEHQLETPGAYVELFVTDTGCGMDEPTRARVFEPFFTTKPRGKGTGLGLAMVHDTVRRHGGSITLASELGRGTTFRIFLHRQT